MLGAGCWVLMMWMMRAGDVLCCACVRACVRGRRGDMHIISTKVLFTDTVLA